MKKSFFTTVCILLNIISISDISEAGTKFQKVKISGEKARNGVFDPSIEYENNGKTGWMAYAAVMDFPRDVSLRIARTLDNGRSWEKMCDVNFSMPGMFRYKNRDINGIWRHEVPTLVHDPEDPDPKKRWKLFWHRYFARPPYSGPDHRLVDCGWIAYKHAATPSGPWSEEIALLGAGNYMRRPFKAQINLNALHPDLKNIVAFTEPGAVFHDGHIYLALQGQFTKKKKNRSRIFLIYSGDNGQNWKYAGTLVDEKDAGDIGCYNLVAPSITREKGRVFLMLSPLTDYDHFGTVILEFSDMKKAQLVRDETGRIIISKRLSPSIITNAGESDYDEHNTAGGIVMPQANPDAWPEILQIYNTGEKIIVD